MPQTSPGACDEGLTREGREGLTEQVGSKARAHKRARTLPKGPPGVGAMSGPTPVIQGWCVLRQDVPQGVKGSWLR